MILIRIAWFDSRHHPHTSASLASHEYYEYLLDRSHPDSATLLSFTHWILQGWWRRAVHPCYDQTSGSLRCGFPWKVVSVLVLVVFWSLYLLLLVIRTSAMAWEVPVLGSQRSISKVKVNSQMTVIDYQWPSNGQWLSHSLGQSTSQRSISKVKVNSQMTVIDHQ